MTYREVLIEGTNRLSEKNISEFENNAWLLFEYVFKLSRHQYFMKMNDAISDDNAAEIYRTCIEKRATHVPVQYITGSQDFMGLNFLVNENVLIPRQDTEILVEKVLNIIEVIQHNSYDVKLKNLIDKESIKENIFKVATDAHNKINVLDMCTGSGCIAISVSLHGNVDVTAVDISEKALEVAKNNAKNLGADRVKFIESDLFEKINVNNSVEQDQRYDIIVSNPPYIPSKVVDGLMPEVVEHEPRLALDGTEDGLWFYRKITEESLKYIKPNGWLCYEIGCEQGEDVSRIMMDNGYKDVKVIKDLAGLDRVVVAKITM